MFDGKRRATFGKNFSYRKKFGCQYLTGINKYSVSTNTSQILLVNIAYNKKK